MYWKKEYVLIAVILLAGILLRVWGLDFGLPFPLHNDEPIIVNHAVAYGSGDLNPHFFIIPPLCSYILFIGYGAYFVIGKLTGLFAGTEAFALEFFSNPTNFYLIARVVLGVIPGSLSVWFVYLLYKRLFSGGGALFAAVITAVSFLMVVNAHYAYTDNLMVLFVLVAYFFMAGMMRTPSIRNYLLSGVFIALAVSTKYNAGLLLISFLIAHASVVLCGKRSRTELIFNRYLWAAAGISLLVFVITNPFSVLDWRFFLFEGVAKIRPRGMGWTHHITFSLFEGIGPALVTAGFIGLFMILVRERLSKKLFFLSFPVMFYLHLVFQSQRFSRYALPLVPFFAIAVAFLMFRVIMSVEKTRLWRALTFTLCVMMILPTTVKALKADMLFGGQDTRVISAAWIEENIPRGSKIAVDHTSYRPRIYQSREQLIEKYDLAGSQEGLEEAKKKKIEYMTKAVGDKKTYNVFFLEYGKKADILFLSESPVISGIGDDIGQLKDNGIEYVIINYNTHDKFEDIEKELGGIADKVTGFNPYKDHAIRSPYPDFKKENGKNEYDLTYMSIGTKEIFSRQATGPCLVIYRINPDKK